jgi:hypothetical protein
MNNLAKKIDLYALVNQPGENHKEMTHGPRKSAILKLVFSDECCKYLLLNIIHCKQSPYHQCAIGWYEGTIGGLERLVGNN